jgi:kynureninase
MRYKVSGHAFRCPSSQVLLDIFHDQLLPPFVDVDSAASKLMASVVGASQSEVAVMGTLTANLLQYDLILLFGRAIEACH